MDSSCPQCGKETLLGQIFCSNCGASLKSSSVPHDKNDKKFSNSIKFLMVLLVAIVAVLFGAIGACFLVFTPMIGSGGLVPATIFLCLAALGIWSCHEMLSRKMEKR